MTKRVVFITGASSGFGFATSLRLAQEGYRVAASMRDLRNGAPLLDAAERQGVAGRIECVRLDVTDPESVHQAVGGVVEKYGTIDVLINNAGYAQGGFVEELDLEAWKRQFETNFFGMVTVTRSVLPVMRTNRRGIIVNISSISGRVGFPGMGPYVASKFAVEGFSESLRLEMLPYGVYTVLIEPGAYKTNIWSKGLNAFEVKRDSPYYEQALSMIRSVETVAEHAGDPAEVAETIARAIQARRPKLRYPVGGGVKAGLLAKALLPWKWLELVMEKRLRGQMDINEPLK